MAYLVSEVDGLRHAELLHAMNGRDNNFPQLQVRHLIDGYWWIAQADDGLAVGFAGMVPMVPFERAGYLKRAYVLPTHRGHGLQVAFLREREKRAKQLGWGLLVAECGAANRPSQNNFIRAGFERFDPEQCWGESGAVYFKKKI